MAKTARVVVLGGGLAGLAAAVRLAEAGYSVELLERRTVLGGRASSFRPPGETAAIDNCQHVLLGCCTNLLDFFQRTGNGNCLRFYSSFLFLGPRGLSTVGASPLPAPLHLLPSLLRFRDLDWRDRWAVVRGMMAILRSAGRPSDEPLSLWMSRHRQTPRAIDNFWRVILTSALNEDIERLSALPAAQVFWEAFLRNRAGYRMAVPTIPLSDLYGGDILKDKCDVRLGAAASAIELSDGSVRAIRLQTGERREADYFVSAVPPDTLANLLRERPSTLWPDLSHFASWEWSPIAGIHLWFDRPVTKLEHVAILGRTIQWVFNKSAIGNPRGNPTAGNSSEARQPQYIQLVISASRSLMTLPRDQILELALRELGELFPKTKDAKLLRSVVVKEAESTVSFQPGFDAARPDARTPLPNLFLAGDWTANGWPPTMEAAVRSGYRAAELVTEAAGNPQKFLRPGLPTAPLVRLLAGKSAGK